MVQHILIVRLLLEMPSKMRVFPGGGRKAGLSAVDKQLPGNSWGGQAEVCTAKTTGS